MTTISPADIEMARRYFDEKLKTTLGPFELKEMMDDPASNGSFTLVDVRNKDGYREEHIPGAMNIPEEELESRLKEIPKEKPVIVYCWTEVCHLAAHAGLTLAKNGYLPREMEGGIQQWKAYEFPVEKGAMASVG